MKKIWGTLLVIVVIVFGLILLARTHKAAAPKAAASRGSYVALGDSIAAGVGLKDYSDSSACDRTAEAYPNLLARADNYKLTSLACSGATLPVGVTGSQTVNRLALAPQLQKLFARPKPALISLTIGANDADWSGSIQKCYLGDCGSAADTAEVDAKLQVMAANLQAVLAQIRRHYGAPAPKVLVSGYYQVFPPAASACSDLTGITAAELTWGRQQQAALNQTLQTTVAAAPGVTYAPVNFAGHELCSTDPWVQGLAAPAPYHPTAAGQATIAKQLNNALRSRK